MDTGYDVIDFSGPPVNPAIRHLWDLKYTGYAHHARACMAYSQWMVGYIESEIAIFLSVSAEEIHADLEYVRELLSEEAVLLHLREREEIRDSVERSKKMREELSADLSLPIDELHGSGRNPAEVLRRYREAVSWEDEPIQIKALRKQNSQAGISEVAEIAPEEENQLIAALRRADQTPSAKTIAQSRIAPEPKPATIQQSAATGLDIGQRPGAARTDRRVTVRLDPDLFEKVLQRCNDLGVDLSTAIRRALAQSLEGDSALKDHKPMTMPAESLALIGRYQVWGSDLKEKLRESFLQLLAMAYVTERRWPRAMWIKELHHALLPLYRILEGENVRQN